MARLWSDSFDLYASTSDCALRYDLGAAGFTPSSTTAFSAGQSGSINGTLSLLKTFETATNETTVYFSVRVRYNSASTSSGSYYGLTFQDGSNAQVTVMWNGDGSISLRSGSSSGTLLASSPYAGQFSLNSWDSWQGKIVINNTTGTIELRKNGSTSPAISLTAQNTRAGSTNAYVNKVQQVSNSSNSFLFDDLWINSDTAPNPVGWPGDIRAIQQLPTANSTAGFSSNLTTASYGQVVSGADISWPTGNMIGVNFTPTRPGSGNAVQITLVSGFTGHVKAAIYDSNLNLLGQSAAVTNPSAGVLTMPMISPPGLSKNSTYYAMVMSDATMDIQSSSTSATRYIQGRTYSLDFPAVGSFAGVSFVTGPWMLAVVGFANFSMVNDVVEDGDTSYVYSSTPGTEDLYSLTSVSTIPGTVLGVVAYAYWRKSDAGARQAGIQVQANSSADTTVASVALPSTYTLSSAWLPNDPTGVPWTLNSLNGALLGVKVIA